MTMDTATQGDARQAHVDLFNNYAHALDTCDWDLLAGLFTEDITFHARVLADRKPAGDDEVLGGSRDAVVSTLQAIFRGLSATHHMLGNHAVKLAPDGRSARASCYMRAYHQGNGDRAHLFEESLGRFDADTVLDGGAWKIRRMDETVMVMLGTVDAFPPRA
jgi:hypothetical protein